jgi:hypothetical protein
VFNAGWLAMPIPVQARSTETRQYWEHTADDRD